MELLLIFALIAGLLLSGLVGWVCAITYPEHVCAFACRCWDSLVFTCKREWVLYGVLAFILILIFNWAIPQFSDETGPKAVLIAAAFAAIGWVVSSTVTRAQGRLQATLSFVEHMRSSPLFIAHQHNASLLLPYGTTFEIADISREYTRFLTADVAQRSGGAQGCTAGLCKGARVFGNYQDVPLLSSAIYLLNSFESIAGAILLGKADEAYFRRYAIYILQDFFDRYVHLIAFFNKGDRNGQFSDLIKLLNKWHWKMPENHRPAIPGDAVQRRDRAPWRRIEASWALQKRSYDARRKEAHDAARQSSARIRKTG